MSSTDTCLSRMEDGFDSRRRYKTENQSFTIKSRCLISLFSVLATLLIIRYYPLLSACFVANLLQILAIGLQLFAAPLVNHSNTHKL